MTLFVTIADLIGEFLSSQTVHGGATAAEGRAERRPSVDSGDSCCRSGRGARNLRVFGSVARGETNESSDLDLLAEWEPDRSLLDHAGFVQDLEELLGIKVHVGTEKSLNWYIRDRVLREATPP